MTEAVGGGTTLTTAELLNKVAKHMNINYDSQNNVGDNIEVEFTNLKQQVEELSSEFSTHDHENVYATNDHTHSTINNNLSVIGTLSCSDLRSTTCESINTSINSLSTTVNNHTTSIDSLNTTVDNYSSTLSSINTTVNSHSSTLSSINNTINSLKALL